MSSEALLRRARGLWQELAAAPVRFGPVGTTTVVVSANSLLCPSGWVGFIALGGAAIVTVPDAGAAPHVRAAFAGVTAHELADEAAMAELLLHVLPVRRTLGPAALSYVEASGFRPVAAAAGSARVERLAVGHPALRALAESAGEQDAGEAGIDEITSPVFVVRDGDVVLAACGYRHWLGRSAHICVLTDPAWRGRGLARVTASAAVAHALAQGLLPQWRARVPASRRVARALGFEELGAQISFEVGR